MLMKVWAAMASIFVSVVKSPEMKPVGLNLGGEIMSKATTIVTPAKKFLALPLVFYGLEVFVGVIQGFVFCVLTLAFMSIATTPHHSEEHH